VYGDVAVVRAAAVWMQYLTSYGALLRIAKQTPVNAVLNAVLIPAASGSVGLVSVQIADLSMGMDSFNSGKLWVVSHKPVAVAAGLGQMGIHRNVIHPRFGNFILLGTVLLDTDATAYDQPLASNLCLECKLCVAECPTGAIAPDGHFNFSACNTHNYRELMDGFTEWVEQVADSKNALDYQRRVADPESASMW
jgi:ferredoxin